MKAFIATSGAIFALLLAAHVARFLAEGDRLLGAPIFVTTTIGSAGMGVWAGALLVRPRR